MSILTNKIIDDTIRETIREVRKYVRDREYDIDYNVKIDNDSVIIQIKIFAHFDITEVCSERLLSKYSKNEDIEITEEEYKSCVEDLIENINIEYALYKEINIKSINYDIKAYALECDSDDCNVGGVLEIKINKDVNDISHVMHYIKYIIMLLLDL
ncbi:MAG: hypothetical protein QXH21_09240 [Ignisphaera sp.]